MLEQLIKTYLTELGFQTYTNEGLERWGHPSLGYGRRFLEAVEWTIGAEHEGRDLRAEARATV